MIELSSITKPKSSDNTCPKCSFSGSKERFPKGYASQNLTFNGRKYPVKHCPECGYWDASKLSDFNKLTQAGIKA